LIDEIDLALFRILRRAHDLRANPPNQRLINAIRVARALSEALLPDSKRRSVDTPSAVPPPRDKAFDDVMGNGHLRT
jgi:hypothetical protein